VVVAATNWSQFSWSGGFPFNRGKNIKVQSIVSALNIPGVWSAVPRGVLT
jgi:hypothetical protein